MGNSESNKLNYSEIRQALYNRYIQPTKRVNPKYVGVEFEMPIINLDKSAVNFENIFKLTDSFMNKFDFEIASRDDNGNINSVNNSKNGDILSYDCSYNNLELSFGREKNLFEIQNRFNKYYMFIQNELKKYNYMLSGFGVNPYKNYNNNVPIPNGRYRMLFHHLKSYVNYDLPMYFHSYPEYGTFSSASQVQLDVTYENLTEVLNTFSKLEPIKALIFSNSVLLDEQEELACCRDMFWENSTHGINPHNVGMYNGMFSTPDDILDYIETTSIYCLERDKKYINFPPVNIVEFLLSSGVEGEYFDNESNSYKKIFVEPRLSDIEYLRTFKFEDLTFRGTVEFRSVCCQPIKDNMTVAAFHVGLMNKLHELTTLMDNDTAIYNNGYNAAELRKIFNKSTFPSFFNSDKVYTLAKEVLNLASEGLKERGNGEEILLEPLYKRVEKHTNPACEMLRRKNSGENIENIIIDFA